LADLAQQHGAGAALVEQIGCGGSADRKVAHEYHDGLLRSGLHAAFVDGSDGQA